jgi:hypothetical protein
MILDLAIIVARGLASGREYEAGGVAVYLVPGIYGGRSWAVLQGDAEQRHPTPVAAAMAFLDAADLPGAAARRRARIAAARERGWRRAG